MTLGHARRRIRPTGVFAVSSLLLLLFVTTGEPSHGKGLTTPVPAASSAPAAAATKEEPPHAYRSRHTKKGTYYVRPRFGAVARVSTWLARQNEDEPIRRAQEAASLLRGERVLIKRFREEGNYVKYRSLVQAGKSTLTEP
ncbi:uncharacterized protein [Dermacentor andersoni]|uniref:uncharacterized protein n=1 Tax=Dermacentor andersoni TaxID=34620 RepID=UPI003B3B32E2